MRHCHMFSAAVVAIALLGMTGCAAPAAKTLQGASGADSPINQAMEAPAAGYGKRPQP